MDKWVLVVVLLIVAILVAFGIFVATGVIDGPALFWRVGLKTPWLKPHLETYSHGQDAENWVAAQEGDLRIRVADLENWEAELVVLGDQLEQRSQQLDRRESELDKQMASFREEQAQRQNIKKLAEIYTEMTAEEGARIIEKLEQPLILEVLLAMDIQDAANILTRLPTNLAVTLSKQLGQTSN